ncbi:Leucine-rich-repeat receptor-like protein [Melia azedarach]|uniref:Leucine-rich-repeat receptor-like protein n=1 Tax=Melia azedarach TaxID=155640 RepID=A0ACC1WZQ7_MELAZ|nr:Leucine-rich-repeat receptor-like protein [Melia azedarach]
MKAMVVNEDEGQSVLKHLHFGFLLVVSPTYYQDAVAVTSKGLKMELVKILTLFTSIGLSSNNFKGQCQNDQQSLLLQMKKNLVFSSSLSVNLVQWSQSIDCCSWGGVDCDEAGRVIGLDLSNESISGGIDNAIGLFSLQYLERLNLAFNRFSGTQIPYRLAALTNLIHLNLSNAGFAGQIPLQNLTEIRELYLDGVNISALGNEWCQALSSLLPKLQVLSLSSCFLSGPIHPSLARLRSLSVIRLDQNNLSAPVPEFLADFFNLTSLRLSNCGLYGTFPRKILQVPTLETVDLSTNSLLHGSLPDFPKNHRLQTLILSTTNFSGTLPDSIGNLKSLCRIEIPSCNFTGSIPTSMANLTQLVYLDLSSNHFFGPIPSLHMSRNLAYLDLSHNFFTGTISSIMWKQLSNLVYVDLRYNSLNGSISPSLFALPSVQKLQLDNNQFEGRVPEFPDASSSVLDTLDLSGNRLEGPIPKSIFELKNLKILILSSNKFNDTVQFDKFQSLGNLTTLDLSYNSLVVNANSSNSSFFPQISTLRLGSCKLREIPNLKDQSRLFHLYLSENQISGEIPNWIWEVGNRGLIYLNLSHNLLVSLQQPYSISNTTLSVLDLHSNQLQGNMPQLPLNAVHVDYSNNNFTSSIRADIGIFMSSTIFFSLANNSLTGFIPESICDAQNLLVLDLSNNNFSGMMPTCLSKMSETLGVLNLRRNNLSGNISSPFPTKCTLQTLDLNGNNLEGMIPKSLANCTMLEVLNLGNNQISDAFPCWLKNISHLRVLVLRSNRFYGNISCRENNDSWPMLQIVDLASNNFSGRLPWECLKTWKAMMIDEDVEQSKIKHLHYEFMRLSKSYYQDAVTVTSKGLEMELVKILTLFTSIDFSRNNFEGPIPEEIGQFKSLYVLNLSHNAFTGSIPSAIGNLRQLESLDLKVNKLSGVIPKELASLNFLSVLNLSYNNLVGMIPSSTQLQSFLGTSYIGNERLCGAPLNDCINSSNLPPSKSVSSDEFDWQFTVTGVGFGIGSAVVVASLIFSKKANKLYDDQIDKFLMVILPMVGFTYTSSHERSVEAEENLEDEITDDDDHEMETEEFQGRYCVFCSKLDVTREKGYP